MPITISIDDTTSIALVAAIRDGLAVLNKMLKDIHHMSEQTSNVQTAIDKLIADNATLKSAVDSAPAAIATLVAAAIAAQANNGVTAEQMEQLANLHAAMGGEAQQLIDALAGTPPVPTPDVPATA